MAASFKDPSASAVTRAEASVVFPSISAASSAYSNLDMSTELSPLPTTTPELATSCDLNSLQASDERNRGEEVSLKHSSFNVEWLRHHIRPTRQSDAHDSCRCGEDGLDDTSHLRADAGIRKCTIEEDLTFRIECRTIVDEGYYGIPTLSKHHGDKPAESTHVVSAPSRWSESSLGVWEVTVQDLHQSASNDSV